MWSRGKRSVRLDLTTSAGRDRVHELAADADVMITALEPATADRFGVDGAVDVRAAPATRALRNHRLRPGASLERRGRIRGCRVVGGRTGPRVLGVLFDGARPAFPAVPVGDPRRRDAGVGGHFRRAARTRADRSGAADRDQPASGVERVRPGELGAGRGPRAATVRRADAHLHGRADARRRVAAVQSERRRACSGRSSGHLSSSICSTIPRFRSAPNIADPDDARALRRILLDRVRERTWDEWQAVFAERAGRLRGTVRTAGRRLAPSADAARRRRGRGRRRGARADAPARTARHDVRAARTDPQPPRHRAPACLLQGVTVLELSTWIATPMATALLAELGARVVKIEPLEGDPLGGYGPMGFKCVQGKESIALDLKTDEGRGIVHRLAERADALVHNYRPGVPERLGIDDATLRALNPGLIYLYAASYGSTGPMSGRPAFHVTAGAVCGGALAQSGGDGAPGPSVALSDVELAWWSRAAHPVQRGQPRLQRGARGRGRGDDGVVRACPNRRRAHAGDAHDGLERLHAVRALHRLPGPTAAGLSRRRCCTDCTRSTACTGRVTGWVFLAAADDHDFARLCEALDQPRLAQDPRFSTPTRRARGTTTSSAGSSKRSSDNEALTRAARDLAAARRRMRPGTSRLPRGLRLRRAVGGGARTRRGCCRDGSGPVSPLRPCRPHRTRCRPARRRRRAGAQTRSILTELGYTDDEVDTMCRQRHRGHAARVGSSPTR